MMYVHFNEKCANDVNQVVIFDEYYGAPKLITLPYILFIFIKIKFIHRHSCVMFVMKSMSIWND